MTRAHLSTFAVTFRNRESTQVSMIAARFLRSTQNAIENESQSFCREALEASVRRHLFGELVTMLRRCGRGMLAGRIAHTAHHNCRRWCLCKTLPGLK